MFCDFIYFPFYLNDRHKKEFEFAQHIVIILLNTLRNASCSFDPIEEGTDSGETLGSIKYSAKAYNSNQSLNISVVFE